MPRRRRVRRMLHTGLAAALIMMLTPSLVRADEGDLLDLLQTVKDDDGAIDGLDGSQGIAITPDGRHVYATGSFDNSLVTLSRAPDGTLTFLGVVFDTTPGVDGLDSPRGTAVSPDGKHVYVAALFDNSVAVFSRDAGTGVLTFVEVNKEGGGVEGLGGAHGVTVSPDGKHVYVAARTDDAVTVWDRDAVSGALAFVQSVTQGVGGVTGLEEVEGVVVTPDGKFVYSAAEGSHAIAVFARDSDTGELDFVEAVVDGAGGVDGLHAANSVVVSPDGKHLYASGEFDNGSLDDDDLGGVFSRNQMTGRLTFVEVIPPFIDTTGDFECFGVSGGGGIAIDSAGDQVLVTESWNTVLLAFARSSNTGRLELAHAGCHFSAGLGNINQVVASSDGLNVYTTGLNGSVGIFGSRCDGRAATILGTNAADVISGTGGADVIVTGDGDDVIDGLGGNDTICGGSGDDEINGRDGNDALFGNRGADVLRGGAGNDMLDGGIGNDEFRDGPGDDTVKGGAGNDRFVDDPGADDYDGGDGGGDRIDLRNAPTGVAVDLAAGEVEDRARTVTDTFTGIEQVRGSKFDDILAGTTDRDVLLGSNGDDVLRGLGGDDTLKGNKGDDTMKGGGGDDLLIGAGGDDSLLGNAGDDTLNAGPGDDTAKGGAGADSVDGGGGTDRVFGNGGFDTVNGGPGPGDVCRSGEAGFSGCEVVI